MFQVASSVALKCCFRTLESGMLRELSIATVKLIGNFLKELAKSCTLLTLYMGAWRVRENGHIVQDGKGIFSLVSNLTEYPIFPSSRFLRATILNAIKTENNIKIIDLFNICVKFMLDDSLVTINNDNAL